MNNHNVSVLDLTSKFVIALAFLAGIFIAFYAAIQSGEGNIKVLVILLSAIALVWVGCTLKENAWLLFFISFGLTGSLNFLPLGLTPFECTAFVTSLVIVFHHTAMMKRLPRFGPAWLWMPLLPVIAILLYHAFVKGGFGLSILGSDNYGGRRYLGLFIGMATYTAFTTSLPAQKLNKAAPWLLLVGPFIHSFLDMLWLLAPTAGMYIYSFYGYLSRATELVGDDTRFGGIRQFAYYISVLIFSSIAVRKLLRPKYWIITVLVIPTLLFGSLLGGYRSGLVRIFAAMGLGTWLDLKWKSLILFPLFGLALIPFYYYHHNIDRLPYSAQRVMTIFPGDWDLKAVESTQNSNEFRTEIFELWWKQEFENQPLLGRGFHFDGDKIAMLEIFNYQSLSADAFSQSFVITGDLHDGKWSLLDNVGIIGAFFFLLSNIIVSFFLIKQNYHKSFNDQTLLQKVVFIMFFARLFNFYVTDGFFYRFFLEYTFYLGVIYIAYISPQSAAPKPNQSPVRA